MPEVFNNEVLCKRVIKIPLPDYMLNLVETVVITGRNEVVAMVIYLHLSVIHSVHRGGGLPQCMLGYHHPPGDPPGVDTPQDQTPPEQTHPPWDPPWDQTPRSRHHPLPGKQTRIRSTSGRYASYSNAFFFLVSL